MLYKREGDFLQIGIKVHQAPMEYFNPKSAQASDF